MEKRQLIVGLSSKARCGKNTFSGYLVDIFEKEYNIKFIEIAFADALKSMCKDHFGLSTWQVYGDEKEIPDKRYPRPTKPYCEGLGKSELPYSSWTPREIMQELGSFYRKIDNDFWVKALDERIKELDNPNVIITDVRHVNECEYVKNNGILIRITRKNADKIHGMSHESETALDDKPVDYFDITISNSGTLDDLKKVARDTVFAIIKINNLKGGTVYNG